ncbi:MAG: DUF3459 domain-containing protein, partial [Lachnospiraceae bacterium]
TVNILLRGIPFIYQGQEIGMQNNVWETIQEYDDISTKDQYEIAIKAGVSKEDALKVCERMSRDNARTPVQWNDEVNAGFSKGLPWMKLNSNYKQINAAQQQDDPDSILHYYQKLLKLRKSEAYKEVFTYGLFEPEYETTDGIMAYYRKEKEKRILVAANFGKQQMQLPLNGKAKKLLLSNGRENLIQDTLKLDSCGVIVLEMQ